MEGPVCLRRNWNPRFLTLESEWANKLRRGCAAALLRKLAEHSLPKDASEMLRQHLEESQITGTEPEADDVEHFKSQDYSLVEGNNMLLLNLETSIEEVRAQHLN